MAAPTTQQISDTLIASISAAISQSVPDLPKSFINVLSKTLAAIVIILYKRSDFIGLQWFVKTASIKETTFAGETFVPLIALGDQIGVSAPGEATQAELLIDITVTNQVGSLASGTQLIGATNGITYILIGSVLLDAPVKQGTFRAVSDQTGGDGSGIQGNLDAGDTSLSFANPLPNVVRAVLVDSQVVTGANAEDLDTVYRQRVLDRFQKRPQGGATADYEGWGEEVDGIINVYPYTGASPGEVDMYSEATELSSGSPDGIPTGAQLTAVLDSVELDDNGLPTRRPANAIPNSYAITRTSFDVEVTGITGVADIAQLQADIIVDVQAYFLASEPYINGLTIAPRRDNLTRSKLIGLVEDLVTAANGEFTTVTFELTSGGGPIESYTLGRGEKSKSTTPTFA